jgi:hypothetical protein
MPPRQKHPFHDATFTVTHCGRICFKAEGNLSSHEASEIEVPESVGCGKLNAQCVYSQE